MEAGAGVLVGWAGVAVAWTGVGRGTGEAVTAGVDGLPSWQATSSRIQANTQKLRAMFFPTMQLHFILQLILIPLI
jgi:hypothetical protein